MRIGILGSADVGCRLGDGFIEPGETIEFESELLTVGSRLARFILIIPDPNHSNTKIYLHRLTLLHLKFVD
jgi:hypothetical protein